MYHLPHILLGINVVVAFTAYQTVVCLVHMKAGS